VAPRLTVQHLVDQPALGLRVVVAGDLDRAVQGAHTMEIESAARWLEPGWLMLTTGMRFAGAADDQSAQSALVDQLVEQGVAALLFGIGVHFDEVPRGLVRAARARDLTVLTVAPDVPFLQVEQFVNRSLLSRDAAGLAQVLWLQNDLLGTLSSDEPVTALVHRLGTLINGTAVLYEESGRVVASTGSGPTMLIWSEIHAHRAVEHRFLVGRWQVVARPLTLRGVGYWIALASRRAQVLEELADPVLDSTERLVGAIRGVRALNASQAQVEATQLLRLLSDELTQQAAARAGERLRAFRFEPRHPARAFVTHAVRPTSGSGPYGPQDPADAALELAHTLGLPLVMDNEPSTRALTGLIGDGTALDEWSAHVAGHSDVGFSEPFVDLVQSPERFRDASRALHVARRRAEYRLSGRPNDATARQGLILRFEDADVVNWLLSSRSSTAFTDKVNQQFTELLEHPDLVETLVTHLARDLDVKATADALYLHPNSVRYRLRRIETMIEAPLQSPAVIANLYVAFYDRISRPDPATDTQSGRSEPGRS